MVEVSGGIGAVLVVVTVVETATRVVTGDRDVGSGDVVAADGVHPMASAANTTMEPRFRDATKGTVPLTGRRRARFRVRMQGRRTPRSQ